MAIESRERIYLRRAEKEDKEFLFQLVNDEECRCNSLNASYICESEHEEWFEKVFRDETQEVYILIDREERVGQGRIELKKNKCRVSYSIIPERRGCGYGKQLIELIQKVIGKVFPQCRMIYAEVLKQNVASKKIFEGLGYTCEEKNDFLLYCRKFV